MARKPRRRKRLLGGQRPVIEEILDPFSDPARPIPNLLAADRFEFFYKAHLLSCIADLLHLSRLNFNLQHLRAGLTVPCLCVFHHCSCYYAILRTAVRFFCAAATAYLARSLCMWHCCSSIVIHLRMPQLRHLPPLLAHLHRQ